MKRLSIIILAVTTSGLIISCGNQPQQEQAVAATETSQPATGQSGVQDDVSQKNVVQVAIGSADHSTLVKAIQQAELVDALSNAGPFTVFAPVNAAFDKLPEGALNDLMKAENKDKLADILQYHVSVGVFKEDMLQNGQNLSQVNGGNISISKNGNEIMINNSAKVLASVPASNGIIYIIDAVLQPK